MSHGNEGYRVKNLKGTRGCTHYGAHAASVDSTTKCAVNGCPNYATRACHVISANTNAVNGRRKIVYMCPSHNGRHGEVFNIRLDARTNDLPDCDCGYFE